MFSRREKNTWSNPFLPPRTTRGTRTTVPSGGLYHPLLLNGTIVHAHCGAGCWSGVLRIEWQVEKRWGGMVGCGNIKGLVRTTCGVRASVNMGHCRAVMLTWKRRLEKRDLACYPEWLSFCCDEEQLKCFLTKGRGEKSSIRTSW